MYMYIITSVLYLHNCSSSCTEVADLWRLSVLILPLSEFADALRAKALYMLQLFCHAPESKSSGGGKGSNGACAPGGTVQGAAFGGAKIWNYKILAVF